MLVWILCGSTFTVTEAMYVPGGDLRPYFMLHWRHGPVAQSFHRQVDMRQSIQA